VWDGMRGSTFDSAIVVAVCTNGRLVGLASIELLLAAPADAVLADVMDIDAPVVAPGNASGAGRMASVEAGGTRSRGGQRIQPLPSPNPPQRLDGILLREHDEDLDRLGRFLASTPDARTASQETVADACGTGCRGWPSAWPARWPRLVRWLASRTRWLPTSRGLLHPRNRVPGRCGRHPDATLAIRGLSVGVGIGRIARREARSPDCSSAAFSRPRCCPSSAGCGTIPHDVDVNTQIEAAVGGQGPSSRS
jgi:magnesium transporter